MTLSLVYLDTSTGVLSSQLEEGCLQQGGTSVVSVNVKRERDVYVNATQAKARANGVL
jgi:hypothetical protein